MTNNKTSSSGFSLTIKALFIGIFILLALGLFWWVEKPTLGTPDGVTPLTSVDLHQIEGPWFEVARLDSPPEKDLQYPSIFIKYAGKGGDALPSFPDPKDPRFVIHLMGKTARGQVETVWTKASEPLKDYKTGTLILPCIQFIPCAFHLIAYDEYRNWMVVAGRFKHQLWIFSRGPGLMPKTLDDIKKKLSNWGYDVDSLRYGNELPNIPEAPPIPKVLPAVPTLPKLQE